MRIRSHLLLLAAGAMLPVLAFAVLISVIMVRQDNATVERGARERARAMMTGVDAMLAGIVKTVKALSASSALAADDLPTFHDEAQRVLATQSTWTTVTLVRPAGEKLIDATQPFGAALRPVRDMASIAEAVRTRLPVVGPVSATPGSAPGVPVRVPVIRDGNVVYVLSAIVRPDSFEDIIRQQRLPDGWVSGIVDSGGSFVARVPTRPAGEPASVAFRAAVAQAPEGWYRGLTVDGRDTYTAHIRSDSSGWAIGLAIPAAIVLAGVEKTSWLLGIGVLVSLALAAAIVALSGRRIARPIVALAEVARSVGTGAAQPDVVDGAVEEVTAVAAALRDADSAVRERQLLIQREKDALQTADRAKDEFIAALSHELRNPLAALTSASHILRTAEPANPLATDARSVVERQTRHMSRMIEDLLDVSRIIMGKANLVFERLDLAQLVTHTVEAWRTGGRLEHRVVDVDARPAWVLADRTRMEQVIANLLDNAVKFTSAGTHIVVRVARDGDFASLSVTDEGPGLSAHLMAHAFDVFVQGEQGIGRAKGGIGVGLTLVKRLAELQGGSATVASDGPGKGATFTVRLPAVDSRESMHEPPNAAPQHAAPRRVLLVEDNADAREMLRQVLAMNGHDVYEAADGASGVALAGAHDVDVAIIDIGLPDIDGHEVARRVRRGRNRDAKLIALTGYGQPEDRQRALAAGFDIHLVKPVSLERLDEAIATPSRSARQPAARSGD
jgi:signal transduction histidine kinase/ActR/RegA family two-component response regulator